MQNWMAAIITIMVFLAFSPYQPGVHAQSGYGWGFNKNDDHELPDIGKYKQMLEGNDAYYADESGEKNIYLTFDNGYEEGYTDDILDVLNKHHVPATFFVTGQYVDSEPNLVKRMANEGHIIGNHSYHHPDFTTVTKKTMRKELESVEKEVANVSNQEEIKYLRPPQGTFNEKTLKWSNELGYINIFWSLAFTDWDTDDQQGWKYAYDKIMEQIHPGALILLHTVSSDNAKALDKLITDLKNEGYQFRSLDHLVLKTMLPRPIYGY
ncbi:delta-lactam-biosynthetic de-N-acetylase [Lentibacillus halophilus]|uniref:Delta-lactam-biosynthetic de-N-acetylase n=1 Tax=Lentibacillus halophilus TaxID=295065 RepID=A0ABP3J7K5_9BACI